MKHQSESDLETRLTFIFVEVQDMEAFELLFSRSQRRGWTIFKP
jgi:hypothetical protein